MSKHLRLVTEARPRAFVFWPAEDDMGWFDHVVQEFKAGDYFVVNEYDERPADQIELRSHLVALSASDALVLPPTWWASMVGHQITQIASWLGIPFLNEAGDPIPTIGAKAQ